MVVPRLGLVDGSIWEQSARLLVPRSNALSEVIKSEKGAQSEAVKDAVKKGASALILVAPDDAEPELAATLRDAREFSLATRGRPLPIVLAGKGIEALNGEFPIVQFASLDQSMTELINATLEDARKAGYGDHPKAVVLYNGPYDDEGQARIDAARRALDEAQTELLTDVAFVGYQAEAATAIKKALAEQPDLAILIATEDQGARAAATIRDQLDKSQKRFSIGVVGPRKELERLSEFNIISGHVVRDTNILARRAVTTALQLLNGEPVTPESLVVEVPFLRSSGPEQEGFTPVALERQPKAGQTPAAATPEPAATPE